MLVVTSDRIRNEERAALVVIPLNATFALMKLGTSALPISIVIRVSVLNQVGVVFAHLSWVAT